jgi:hypothetical protein
MILDTEIMYYFDSFKRSYTDGAEESVREGQILVAYTDEELN